MPNTDLRISRTNISLNEFLNPEGLVPTQGRYSQIVRATGRSILFISGQVSRDGSGNIVGKGDFAAQAEQIFTNLSMALRSQRASFTDVTKITTYVIDMRFRDELRKVVSKYFQTTHPASTLVEVSHLADPDYMLEIEAIAVVE
ncbi:MAG: RidA family protein [Nitrososphaerales archaeon]